MRSLRDAWVIQVFAPLSRQSPPTVARAWVLKDARSDPVSGSVNTAVGSTSPEASLGNHRIFCAAVPLAAINSPAISDRVPKDPAAISRD